MRTTATLLRSRTTGRGRSATRVTLIQHVLDGSTAAAQLIPGPRDLSITVGIQNLTAPADCSLLGFDFVFGLRIDLIVNLRVDPSDDWPAQFVEVHGLVRIVIELEMVC